ncbi:uncharacterized protein LOC143253543 [Tachypleus tridentatus]|uniref:uncharacterized protein LOC143253543 n=1 Tax=Tachypleus tridentatus TaxID=6853 RepID=UPI003FD353E1
MPTHLSRTPLSSQTIFKRVVCASPSLRVCNQDALEIEVKHSALRVDTSYIVCLKRSYGMSTWILFSVTVTTLLYSIVFSQIPENLGKLSTNGLSYGNEDPKQTTRSQVWRNLLVSSEEGKQDGKSLEKDYRLWSPILSRQARNAPGQYEKFYEFLIGKGLNKFCKYLRLVRPEDILSSTGTFTVFAPNDKAFTLIPGGTLEQIANDHKKLREFILYHIVPGSVSSSSIRNDVTQNTVQGTPIRFNVYGQEITVNGAQIADPNGHYNRDTVHVIDRVLYPVPSMDLVGQTKWTQVELYGLLVLAGLDKRLSDGNSYTIFAPADEAFQNLPPVVSDILKSNVTLLRQVLLNHVLKGTYYSAALKNGLTLTSVGGAPLTFSDRRGLLLVNGIPVVEPNFMVLNGVIHVINRVLLPEQVLKDCQCLPEVTQQLGKPPSSLVGGIRQPSFPPQGTSPPGLVTGGGAPPPTGNNILQIIEMPGLNIQGQPVGLTIFYDLLKTSDLTDTLTKQGPFTVLVPTDDAFSNLPSEVLNELRNNPQLLRRVLLNHIISLSLNPQHLQNNMVIETNSGLKLFVSVPTGGQKILIGGPSVIASTLAQNGYVFVINRVLYPLPKRDISVALKDRPNLSQLLSLVIKSGLENTLRGAGPYTVFAPTDEAFAALPENVLEKLLSNPGALKELILNHVVDSVHYKKEFTSGLILPTSRGQQLRFFVTSDRSVKVNNANIVEFDILTENGVIHSIDRVLFTQPSSQLGAGTTSFRPGTPPIGQPQHPSTHFRPGTPPRGQPQRPSSHTRPGTPILGQPPISTFPVNQHGGASSSPPRLVTGGGSPPPTGNTINQIIKMPGLNVQGQPVGLTIFQDLLQQSGVDILKQRGPFTVLVPTDDAFSNLPSGVLNELRNNPQLLRHVLLNHIISLSLNPQDLQNNMVVETNSGLKLFVSVLNGGQKILIGGPSVIASTLAQNGYVFVINRVLYPLPKRDISVALKDRPNLSQLLSLVIKSGLENTLRGAGPYTVFAPTDEAFAALPENVLEKLLSNPGALKELILNHVVDSVHYKKEFTSGLILPTSRGQQLRFLLRQMDLLKSTMPTSSSSIS